MKKILKIILVIFIVLVILGYCFFSYITFGMKEIKKTVINDISLANVKDGTYEGIYKGNRWANTTLVTVNNHQITNVKVTKKQLVDQPDFINKIIVKVMEKQSLKIDTISGATISTKAYLIAIQRALEKGTE